MVCFRPRFDTPALYGGREGLGRREGEVGEDFHFLLPTEYISLVYKDTSQYKQVLVRG